MDETLKIINKEFIQLKFNDIKTNNEILDHIVKDLIQELKKDSLFDLLYERVFFGGSFYDGLKVGSPNEFDIDLVLKFPAKMSPIIYSPIPGHVGIELYKFDDSNLNKLFDNNYLSSIKVMMWFQSILDKMLSSEYLKQLGYHIKKRYGAPAATLQIMNSDNDIFDVDFVPSFKFPISQLPGNYKFGWMEHQLSNEFLVVPKPFNAQRPNLLRLSFQSQERELLHNKSELKPAIRLLKFLRDRYNDEKFRSYFIKTIALTWLNKNPTTWKNAKLSTIFKSLMQECIDALAAGKIPYYWHPEFNLLCNTSKVYTTDLANQWRRQLRKINTGDHQTILEVFKASQGLSPWTESPSDSPWTESPDSSGALTTADTDSGLNGGAIIGISLGVGALTAGLLYLMRNRDD